MTLEMFIKDTLYKADCVTVLLFQGCVYQVSNSERRKLNGKGTFVANVKVIMSIVICCEHLDVKPLSSFIFNTFYNGRVC